MKPAPPPTFEEYMDANGNSGSSTNNSKFLPVIRQRRRTIGIQKVKELEQKVQALEEAIQTDAIRVNALTYSEDELLAIYEDVLAVDAPQPTQQNEEAAVAAIRKAKAEEDKNIIKAAHRRLCGPSQGETLPHHQILSRVNEIVSRVEAARLTTETGAESSAQRRLPLGILSQVECEALIRTSLKRNEAGEAEGFVELMKRDNMALPEEALDNILKSYANTGQIESVERTMANYLTKPPSDIQRHFHIQAHLKASPPDVLPITALAVLHQYENQNLPVPMRTYTSVITSLLSRPSSLARAQAWDIFSHMRFVAHPNPDSLLYTLMIRACATPVTKRYSSEPEKALDLWTEMTVDQQIAPTVGAYNAVILACARSGTKTYVNEAFRLARQMLDSHRDARGNTSFRPDKKTFCALLEGAKRLGDLGRARWILAEMVNGSKDAELTNAVIDEEVMTHVFHAYASYDPPRQPRLLRTIDKQQSNAASLSEPVVSAAQQNAPTPTTSNQSKDEGPSFAHLPPQSSADVIREAKALFERILHDDDMTSSPPSTHIMNNAFDKVHITSRLLTSYLSIFYKHGSLEESQKLFWHLYERYPVLRCFRAHLEALDRCAYSRRGKRDENEREFALKFGSEVWEKWELLESSGMSDGRLPPARTIERAHSSMIRLLTISDDLNNAMRHLRSFAAKYPPNTVRTPSPKLHIQSTQTSLSGSRPLVRLTSAAEVPDDHVPPLLTFRDLEVLHHRLIDYQRTQDIKYVTWLCKAYEWALRVRRDETIRAKPAEEPVALVQR